MTRQPEPITARENQKTRGQAATSAKRHPVIATLAIAAVALTILAAAIERQPTAPPDLHPRRPATSPPHTATDLGVRPGPAARTPNRVRVRPHSRARRIAPAAHRLWPTGADYAARRFVTTYLRFTYAQLPASKIRAVAPQLQAHIAANPPEVPEQIHRLHPRVTTLTIIPARIADAGTGWAATVTVTDGRESYQIIINLAARQRRWLATAILAP
jgi:hypothetical protein